MKEQKRINLRMDRCTGCYACVVACLDEHYDIDEEFTPFRHVLKMERENSEGFKCCSMGCMHCDDTPCVFACPTGAVYKDAETGLVAVDRAKCVGCHSCLLACPYGAPRFDKNNKMIKCDGCIHRVKAGLQPACVAVCPSRALSFTSDEEIRSQREKQLRSKLMD